MGSSQVVNGQVVGSSPDAATVADAPAKVSSPLKTKTFWFAVLGAAVHVAADWKNPNTWVEGISIVGAAYSARQAIAKNGFGL